MSKAKAECASLTVRNTTWKDIDSSKYERKVRKLQVRIAKAHKEKRYNKVKALRYLLATSYEAKALAIRKVTSNKGKRTAGGWPYEVGHWCQENRSYMFIEKERI